MPHPQSRYSLASATDALRQERDRCLDLTTRQRLRIRCLVETLSQFVEAAEANTAVTLDAGLIEQARALLRDRSASDHGRARDRIRLEYKAK